MFLFLAHSNAVACSLSPTAKIAFPDDQSVHYAGDNIVFDGTTSTANCGSIDQYRWRLNGSTISWSSAFTHNFSLSDGQSEQVHSIELRVHNTAGKYNTKTIQITVTRNNKSLYYLTDHLGSVRVTVNEQGDPVGWDDYYPFGLQMPGRTQNASNPNDDQKFTGYELEQQGDLNIYHAGARMYDPVIGRFTSQDRFKEKYPSMSPYQYAALNPILFVDVNGDSVQAITPEAQRMILNTLPKEVRGNITFTDDGFIDPSSLESISTNGDNFAALKQLVNDDRLFTVAIASGFKHKDGEESFAEIRMGDPSEAGPFSPQTGEQGFFGITLTPGEDEGFNSAGDHVSIVINQGLSEKGRAQTFAHEGFGHAYLFSIGKNPNHVVRNVNGAFKETNSVLANQIIRSIQETIKNMRD